MVQEEKRNATTAVEHTVRRRMRITAVIKDGAGITDFFFQYTVNLLALPTAIFALFGFRCIMKRRLSAFLLSFLRGAINLG